MLTFCSSWFVKSSIIRPQKRRWASSFTPAEPVHLTLENLIKHSLLKVYPTINCEIKVKTSLKSDSDFYCDLAGLFHTTKANEDQMQSVPNLVIKNLTDKNIIEDIKINKTWLNIILKDEFLLSHVLDKHYLNAKFIKKEAENTPVIVDYSSPNMAKEFHVGHLRSIMHGSTLCSILREQGYPVTGFSHVGDFGTPLGQVIAEVEQMELPFVKAIQMGKEVTSDMLPSPSLLSDIYVTAKKRAIVDPQFTSNAVKCTLQIQQPSNIDNFSKKIWRVILDASRVGFDIVYKKLGITVKEQGESFYVDMLEDTLDELTQKNLLKQSNGATVCFVPGYKVPLLIKSRDGTYLYAATDLAALKYRLFNLGAKRILYITDNSQKNHFLQVFKIGEMAGWYNPKEVSLEHVSFGVVTGADGIKLSTRDGTPLTLNKLLEEAVAATTSAITTSTSLIRAERQDQRLVSNKDTYTQYKDKEIQIWKEEPSRFGKDTETERSLSKDPEAIAYNAIKYFELTNVRKHNYKFSFLAMLNARGNTAMYLLYVYARIRAVFRRANQEGIPLPTLSENSITIKNNNNPKTKKEEKNYTLTQSERELCVQLLSLPMAVYLSGKLLEPNFLCSFLFELARCFNSFYEICRIIGSPGQEIRLQLCLATQVVLEKGLRMLNVEPLERV